MKTTMTDAPTWMKKKWNIVASFTVREGRTWSYLTSTEPFLATAEEAQAAFDAFKTKVMAIQTAIANGRASDPLVLFVRGETGHQFMAFGATVINRLDECIISRHLIETSFIRLLLQEVAE